MSDSTVTYTRASLTFGIGVWWFVWGAKGFWWGVLYGFCWEVWIGYRGAQWLLR